MGRKFWVETLPDFLLPFLQIANALVVCALMLAPIYLMGCQANPVYVVKQYNGDKVMNEWKTTRYDWVEGACRFKDLDGNYTVISGTITVTKEGDQK